MYVEPKDLPFEQFPASPLQTKGMKTLIADYSPLHYAVDLNVEYAVKDGRHLHLQILHPFQDNANSKSLPLIIYVQGSGWYEQNLGLTLHSLLDFAKRGFVIAIAEYRPLPSFIFPAQIKDIKTAVRFMLNNAGKYGIDSSKVVVWGDSSGGHTASMINVTQNDPEYTDEAEAAPLDIKAFVDYYGPSDISRMNEQPSAMDHLNAGSPAGMIIGNVRVDEHPELVAPTVPMNHIDRNNKPRPQLIIHGDKDRTVAFHQSLILYEALRDSGCEAEFYKLAGADHGGAPFWSDEVLAIVEEFIRRWI